VKRHEAFEAASGQAPTPKQGFPLPVIPVFKPAFGCEEVDAVQRVLASGWVGPGPEVEAFEKAFAQYVGRQYALALNSCTAALHLALKVLGVEGREVITTPMTFASTNHAILYNNAIPVFCDIYEDTLNINVNEIEQLITGRTKAIVLMHYGGHACCLDRVMRIANKHNLQVVEDCAHACGAEYKGAKLGSLGDIGCFSFQAVKNLSTGDGGMLVTDDRALYDRAKKLRWLGISKETWERENNQPYDWCYTVEEIGFKYQMNDIAAAIGNVQLRKLDAGNQRRRAIADLYDQALADVPQVSLPAERDYARSSMHNYVIRLERRDLLHDFLQQFGISTGVHYYPNHLYRVYKQFYRVLPVAERVWKTVLTLPLYPCLEDGQVEMIADRIRSFCSSTPDQ
jgi:perosamine synthetase